LKEACGRKTNLNTTARYYLQIVTFKFSKYLIKNMPRLGDLYKLREYDGRIKEVVMLNPRNIVDPRGPIVHFIDRSMQYMGTLCIRKEKDKYPILFRSIDGKTYPIGQGNENIYEIAEHLEKIANPLDWRAGYPNQETIFKICETLSSCNSSIPINDNVLKFSASKVDNGKIIFPLKKEKASFQRSLEDFL